VFLLCHILRKNPEIKISKVLPTRRGQIQNDVGIRHSKERNLVVIAFATMAQSTYL
jgi:hypothetical protein